MVVGEKNSELVACQRHLETQPKESWLGVMGSTETSQETHFLHDFVFILPCLSPTGTYINLFLRLADTLIFKLRYIIRIP